MAISNGLKGDNSIVQMGNRADYCYLCAKEVKAKDEREYVKMQKELVGKLEGQKCVKVVHNGSTFCICLNHLHKIAKENPLPAEE